MIKIIMEKNNKMAKIIMEKQTMVKVLTMS